MTDRERRELEAQRRHAASAIVSTAAAMAAVATNEGRPEEAALWATILIAARRLETGRLQGDAQ